MLKNFLMGAGYAVKGFALINQSGIRRFVLLPFLINLVLFALGVWYLVSGLGDFITGLLPSWLDWLRWLLFPLLFMTALLVAFYTFTLVGNLLAAPFNVVLADRLEANLSHKPKPLERSKLEKSKLEKSKPLRGAAAAVGSEIQKLTYLIKWAIPLLSLSALAFLIPLLWPALPVLWATFSAWMLAIEYADYPMGNNDMFFRDEKKLLAQHRALALGFGGAMSLLTLIPVLNFLAIPVGVAGATALWVEELSPSI
jgi:CysZ protein